MKEILNDTEKQRLIEAIFLLKEQKYVRSFSALCIKCGKNKNYLSDIRANNGNFSGDFIARLFELYPINEQYVLTGDGEILLSAGGNSTQTGDKSGGNIGVNGNGNNYGNVGNTDGGAYEILLKIVETNQIAVSRFQSQTDKFQEQIDRLITIIENKNV